MDFEVGLTGIVCSGEASCVGGDGPDPPIDDYPLLVWDGTEVRTEDGKASVHALALAMIESPSVEATAARYGTTPDHVAQAMSYATAAGGRGI